jgi:flagellar basal body rod protein FlgC
MISAMASAVSALQVSATRVAVSGDNIVNAPGRAPLPAAGEASGYSGYAPRDVVAVSGARGGVRAEVVPVQPAYVPVADGQGGTEARPNTDTASNYVALNGARRGYEAAADVIRAAEEMQQALLDIKS